MAVHEISDVIHKYSKESVKIQNIRIGFICEVCGNHWGVAISDEEDMFKQAMKLVCLNCYQKEIHNNNEKDEKNGYSNNQK
jgi:hypothetical protein